MTAAGDPPRWARGRRGGVGATPSRRVPESLQRDCGRLGEMRRDHVRASSLSLSQQARVWRVARERLDALLTRVEEARTVGEPLDLSVSPTVVVLHFTALLACASLGEGFAVVTRAAWVACRQMGEGPCGATLPAARARLRSIGRQLYKQRTTQEALDLAEAGLLRGDRAALHETLEEAARACGGEPAVGELLAAVYRDDLARRLRGALLWLEGQRSRVTHHLTCYEHRGAEVVPRRDARRRGSTMPTELRPGRVAGRGTGRCLEARSGGRGAGREAGERQAPRSASMGLTERRRRPERRPLPCARRRSVRAPVPCGRNHRDHEPEGPRAPGQRARQVRPPPRVALRPRSCVQGRPAIRCPA